MSLKQIFEQGHIIGFAGNRNSGKTNNLVFLIQQFRQTNKETEIFVYGFPDTTIKYLKQFRVKEIDSLRQLLNKKNCILIIDEMQRLRLNDRRYADIKSSFSDFVYHNNVFTILTSPSIREFNSIIGSIIEGWIVKSIDVAQCVNGSQLKEAIDQYKGNFKVLDCIDAPKDKILVINDTEGIVLHCDYVPEADTKLNQKDLFVENLSK